MSTRAFVAAMVTGVLAGCAPVGPDYQRPDTAASVTKSDTTSDTYRELDGWKRAEPRDAIARGRWWEIFRDPQLDALAERAISANQTIRVAEARQRQAMAVIAQQRAALFPTISVAPSATRNRPPSPSSQPTLSPGITNTYNLPVNASWEADLWGRVRRSIEAADDDAQASAADLESARLATTAALAQAYFALRAGDSQRQILEDTVAASQRLLDLTRNRYAAGVVAKVDIVQAEVQLKSAQAQLLDLGVERAQREHAIAILTGASPAQLRIERVPLAATTPEIPVGVPSELLERRPDIAAAERSVAAANARIGVARAAFFPSLTLTGAEGFRSNQFHRWLTSPSHFWSLGIALAQVIFDGGSRRALSDQAVAAYDAEVALYRQTVLTAMQEVEDNLAALRILADEEALQDDLVQSARQVVELTTNQYKAGVVSLINVLTAQSTALQSERALATIRARRFAASVALIQALGGGWHVNALASAAPASREARVDPAP